MKESAATKWKRVIDVYKAPFQKGTSINIRGASPAVNKIASPVLKVITGGAVIGSAAYLAAKAIPAGVAKVSGALKASAAAKTATIGAATKGGGAGLTLKKGALYAGAGAAAGLLLSRGGSLRQGQESAQYTQPEQEVSPTQATTSDIAQDAFQDASGDIWQSGQNNRITANRSLRSSQDAYSWVYPTQTASPQQITTPSFTPQQSATQGTDFLIPALIIGAALFLKK